MFKSIIYNGYDYEAKCYTFWLEDSEFGIVDVPGNGDCVGIGIIIATEYSKRYSQREYIGRNIAACIIWYQEQFNYPIEHSCLIQDKYCPNIFPNWKDYIPSRDEHLSKIMLLR